MRPASPADRDAIFAVHAAAFASEAEATLAVGLDAVVSLVAEDGRRVVGSVVLSPVELPGSCALALAPLGVLPASQGRGVGAALVRTALTAAAAAGADVVLVLGEPAYYGRFGFVPAAPLGIDDPFGAGDAFQALVLGDRPPRGRPVYPPQFDTA